MILPKHTTFTSLYNGFVDILMKYTSFTSLYNGLGCFEKSRINKPLYNLIERLRLSFRHQSGQKFKKSINLSLLNPF